MAPFYCLFGLGLTLNFVIYRRNLDELGEMSLRMQAVLLRFAETGEIQPIGSDAVTGRTDVRLVTATNRDLRKQIDAGQFREDLYYRLNVVTIEMPPYDLARGRIIFRHALPNVINSSIVFSMSDFVLNIMLVSGLSFLGLGVSPPAPP